MRPRKAEHMNITVLNGGMRHGSTWHCKEAIVKALAERADTKVTEFTLPKDLPHFCTGCYQCFMKGEQACPHAAFVKPIVDALVESDLIVLTSPVYGLDVAAPMKALIDHLCFMWMSHRPNAAMFRKLGLVVTTTAGMGAGRTAKTMRLSLKYWGTKKMFTFKKPVAAMSWDDIPVQKQQKLERDAKALARRIRKAADNIDRLHKPLLRSFVFSMMASMQKGNNWNPTDKAHWERQGWLAGKRPF